MIWLPGWRPLDLTLQASGAPAAIFSPSAYAYLVEGTKHVVFQGSNEDIEPDTQIHELWCEASSDAWTHVNLTTSTNPEAPPASGVPSGYAFEEEQTQHAIYAGNTLSTSDQGKIYEIYWGTDDTKNSNTLTTAAGFGPSVNSPMGYDFGGVQHVVLTTTDSHVWVAERNAAASGYTPSWKSYDLNARYQDQMPAVAADTPTAFAQLDPVNNYTFVHILYWSPDGQIHRFYGSGEAWTYENVSQNAGPAPLAADRPSGFCYQGETLFIIYRSNDGHINILRYPNPFTEYTWFYGTLTGTGGTLSGTGGAPLAGTIPTGYVFPYDNTIHVDYADTAGNVHEIWSADSWEWNWNPLTQNFGGSTAISNLSAYTFAKDNTQHIVYTGDDHHIWELQWAPGVIYRPVGGPGGGILPFKRK